MQSFTEPSHVVDSHIRRVSLTFALVASGACGGLLVLSFPPYGLWWLAPVAVALLAVAVRGRRLLVAGGLGWLAGCVFFIPLLSWTGTQVGWWPWLLLGTFQGLYVGLVGLGLAACTPLFERAGWLWPLAIGYWWVAMEALRSRFPFGGFPWGRLAFSQADAPTLAWAWLGGAPMVTFVVAVAGGLLAWAWWRRSVRSVVAVAGAVAVLACGALLPIASGPGERVVPVAIVQGNVPRLGLDFNAQRRAVLDNHVNATLGLARDVDAGRMPRPELVVWPENSSDIDPFRNADAYAAIDRAATAIQAPILVGAVVSAGDRRARNVAIVWEPGVGPVQEYTKRHPVPFAEYVPLRSVVRAITDKADLVRADFVAGDTPGVLRVRASGGPMVVGDVICFEVAYDAVVRDVVAGGAQLLVTQTNNATFNTAEARQQLAMVQLRSVEHGRWGLMASTVGISAFTSADGHVRAPTAFNTQAVVMEQTHLKTVRTPATRLGVIPEAILAGLALFGLFAAVAFGRKARDEEEA